MSEHLPAKFRAALADEINAWKSENLISAELAELLLSRYPVVSGKSKLVTIITMLGAVLIGLGTLLYVGANWGAIPWFFKLLLIGLAIVVSYTAGWKLTYEPGNLPKLGQSLLVLGSLFYGAAIWLVAQIFNVDVSLPNGLFMWTIGTYITAVATRSNALAVVACIIGSAWTLSHEGYVANPSSAWQGLEILKDLGMSMVLLIVAYLTRSRWALIVSIVGSAMWILAQSKTASYGIILLGATCFTAYLWHRQKWQLFQAPYLYAGTIVGLFGLLATTWQGITFPADSSFRPVGIMLAVALAIQLGLLKSLVTHRNEIVGAMLVCLAAVSIGYIPNELCRLILANGLLIGVLASLIFTGFKKLHHAGLINICMVFIVLEIISRYFDMFFSMMDRSLFFIAGGVVLLCAGLAAEKSRRKLLRGTSVTD